MGDHVSATLYWYLNQPPWPTQAGHPAVSAGDASATAREETASSV